MQRQSLIAEKASLARLRAILRVSLLLSAAILVAALIADGYWMPIAIGVCLTLVLAQFTITHLLAMVSENRIDNHGQLARDSDEQRLRSDQLFSMTDMLQSAINHEDAGEVLAATAGQLMPDLRGALYIFNNSQDRLDLASFWPHDGISDPTKALVPANCWALKRGKRHINDPRGGTLCCKHNGGNHATLEVPMIARGQVHGLLMLASDEPDGADRLMKICRVAQALADSMSLTLANIGLQEKLRTQSLRDPLTGLYNRRYMEDALERYLNISERTGTPVSIIMIDLDHFKRLNDTYGHGKGDAVLRDVAAQLTGAVRPTDIVSRYGGEELLIIMPGCSVEDAMLKAELLRTRIESLSELHDAEITASFGVATVPTTSNSMSDLIPMADAALYAAKTAGRNCVKAASKRPSAKDDKPTKSMAKAPAARLAVG